MAKFNNKFRIESARLQTWDYSWAGSYFVTINTIKRICFFGDVIDGRMIRNEIGEIVFKEWLKGPELRPDMNLSLGEFVVMPDHFHGIITIGENVYNRKSALLSYIEISSNKKFTPQIKNLPSIIRGFKSSVTINAHLANPRFAWQPRFHDRVIRSHGEYLRISEYIKNNPANWLEQHEKFLSKNSYHIINKNF